MKNNLFVNKKVWKEFSDEEMIEYEDAIFNHYRLNGFPYFPTDHEYRNKEIEKLYKYDFTKCIDYKNKNIKQSMHGLSLCWSYHPHHYNVQCNNFMTVMEAFNDDEIFRKVIKKRIRLGDNMSDNGIRKMLKIFSGVQCVSNFRPTASASIYKVICPQGGTVYDMSSGYGGRCLGADLARVKYYGVEPCKKTYNGLIKMIDEFKLDAEIKMEGSEIGGWLEENSVDCCFTSPPYFDLEKHSNEPTQSYKKYKTKDSWINGFMRDTLIECKRVTKEGGIIALNIQNVKKYENLVQDVISLCESIDLKLTDQWNLLLSNMAGKGYKTEPILFFK